MNQFFSIPIALPIPAPEVDALIEGKIVAIVARMSIAGRTFSLYPGDSSLNPLPSEEYYQSDFVQYAETAPKNIEHGLNDDTVLIKAWARCESCEIVSDVNDIAPLSEATIWTPAGLQAILDGGRSIFLAYLRVYHLAEPAAAQANSRGNFISIPLNVSSDRPVLTHDQFSQYCQDLQQRQPRKKLPPPPPPIPPFPPPFDRLQPALTELITNNQAAAYFNQELQQFLELSDSAPIHPENPDLTWIKTIAQLGNRSKEEDTGKSNYQAGTDFENIVRQSLEFLGFTVDYNHTGGAGGLDVFCFAPYPLVVECKSGKKIPDSTAVQLLKLAELRLEDTKKAVKLIIGPGNPTKQLSEVAEKPTIAISIMKPETLEKLVTLESQYPRCIDLFKLKEYLEPGQSDKAVEKYLAEIKQQLQVRSHIVQSVKTMQSATNSPHIDIGMIKGAYFSSKPPINDLTDQQFYQILIELSSYFGGYLGRIPGNGEGQGDRFYWLRDLAIDI